MFVNPCPGETRIVRLPRPTKLNQRVLGSAVVGLLAANAFAAAVIAGDVGGSVAAPVTSESTVPPAAPSPGPQTVTLITTTDGRRLLVDPSTPAGRQAIADAERQGATTQDVPVPVADRTDDGDGPTGTLPGALDLRHVLGNLPAAGALEVDQDVVDHLLQDPAGTITSVVDGAKTTVSSVLGTVQTTVSSVVGTGQSTVSSLLGSTPSTVTSVVGGAQSTVSSLLSPPPTTPPTSSLLGSLITTVSTIVQSVTPTTSAPPPTTAPPGPLCGLLAHC
jgi:hypothetical protein